VIDWLSDLYWSIDPGESKCGVAIFRGGRCIKALKSTPDECLDRLWRHLTQAEGEYGTPLHRPRAVVLERFALRGDLAPMQRGSEMGTSQMIGAIRWQLRYHGVPLVMQTPQNAHAIERAAPFADWPQRRWASYGQGRDAKMAELHGYFRISTSLTHGARTAWHNQLIDLTP
jgi:hypothetical protein